MRLSALPPLIAVIEDEEMIRLGYQMLLEDMGGYRVVSAPSAREVLDCLERLNQRPQIVLSDYSLANGCTGTQAITALRDAFGADLPGILVTGNRDAQTQREAAACGVPILYKPANGQRLLALLRDQLCLARVS